MRSLRKKLVKFCVTCTIMLLMLFVHFDVMAQNLNDQVSFTDENLHTAIAVLAGKPNANGQTPLNKQDIKNIMDKSTTLKLKNKNITSVEGIQVFNEFGIKELDLDYNGVTDLTAIGELTNLESLSMMNNGISNITPIANLTKLVTLKLALNQISYLQPIENLTTLKTVVLGSNKLNEIGSLSGLVNLEYLNLQKNQISEISNLRGLVNLKQLYLDKNKLSNINDVVELVNLEVLYASSNKLTNLEGLKALTNLKSLHIESNKIKDISELSGTKSLVSIFASNNKIGDISVLGELKGLNSIYLSNNNITDISFIDNLGNVNQGNLNYNFIDVSDKKNIDLLSGLFGIDVVQYKVKLIDDEAKLITEVHLSGGEIATYKLRAYKIYQDGTEETLENFPASMDLKDLKITNKNYQIYGMGENGVKVEALIDNPGDLELNLFEDKSKATLMLANNTKIVEARVLEDGTLPDTGIIDKWFIVLGILVVASGLVFIYVRNRKTSYTYKV